MFFDAWEDALHRTCGYFSAVPYGRLRVVEGYFDQRRLHGLDLANVACNISRVDRTGPDVRRDNTEHFFLWFQTLGETVLERKGERVTLIPGTMSLIDSTKPFSLRFGGNQMHGISLHLPRALLLTELPERFDSVAPVESKCVASQELRRLLLFAAAGPVDSPNPNPAKVLSLVRLAFATDKQQTKLLLSDTAISDRFELAIRVLESNLIQPQLTLNWLADRIGISARQLERDFRANNASFSSCVRKKRLKLAREMALVYKRQGRDISITKLAFDVGFRDLSNFNRAVRGIFGCTPSSYLGDLII